MALANAKLGAVHGFAGPIGGRFPAPHGAVCARLLPSVMLANLTALRARAPESASLNRFDELGQLLTDQDSADADAAIAWLSDLCTELQIPPLGSYGMGAADFPELIEAARHSSSMKGNPIALTQAELNGVLARLSSLPLVHGAVLGTQSTFGVGGGPCLKPRFSLYVK